MKDDRLTTMEQDCEDMFRVLLPCQMGWLSVGEYSRGEASADSGQAADALTDTPHTD